MDFKYFLLIFMVVSSNASPFDPPPVEPVRSISALDSVEYRLPAGAVEVLHYYIELRLEDNLFTTNTFDGTTRILFKNNNETNNIQLHANEITFNSVRLVEKNGNIIELLNKEFASDLITDIFTLTTSTPLKGGSTYQVEFNYTAKLRTNEMYGFYKSEYTGNDGKPRYLGTTQFQSTHARKAFPCFDEPIYKAEFDIAIRHPKEYTAVSNSAGSSSDDSSDSKYSITTFSTTPKMSTYLIAFVVSDFTCTETQKVDVNVRQFVCWRANAESTRELAVNSAANLTWALEEFTRVKYSVSGLTKIHHFAIPDFAAGAMENWGLITYREAYLLWDPQESSNRYKQYVISIIAHELAHFWFGDLVTNHWWSDVFLNEGFATYFEYFTTHEVFPDWEMDKQFVIEQLQPVLISDASPNSAPLSSPASSPAEVAGRMSSISYNKGGSIFRMARHFMGLDNFKAGINKYLTTYQFGNTRPEDLWMVMNEFAPGLPVKQSVVSLMENWVTRPGYPILNVTVSGRNVVITQKRFLSSGEPSDDDKWYIPLTYTTSYDTNKFQNTSTILWYLPIGRLTLIKIMKNSTDWIIFNNQQIGYYRVDYDDQLWKNIKTSLSKKDFDNIHEINRAQIVDDFFNFARYGYRSFSQLLDLYKFLKHDTSYYPWYSAFNAFSNMITWTGSDSIRTILSDYILQLVDTMYQSVSFDNHNDDDQIYTHKKVLVIPWACRLGHTACVNSARAAFAEYRKTNKKPNKNMRSVIYCNGLRHSADIENDWQFLWNEFLDTDLGSEQTTILSALGCTKNVTVLNNYLKKSIDPNSGIRRQYSLSVFSSVYGGNHEGVDIALDFLIGNYKEIVEYYGSMNSLSSLFSGLANRFNKQQQVDKFKNFIQTTDLGDATASANAALSVAIINLERTEKFENELKSYFSTQAGRGTSLTGGVTLIVTTLIVFFYNVLL